MVVYLFAGRFSRAEKVRQRKRINLEDAALTDKTKSRYYMALRKLTPYVELAKDMGDLDNQVCKWVRRMWRTGEPLLTIGDGLSALHYFQPATRRQVPHAWKLFSVWRRIEIPSRAPPLTRQLVRGMAAQAMEDGNLEMCVLLLLGFTCLLRTGELLNLTIHDFSLSDTTGVCALRNTKSGRRHSVNEVVSFTDAITLECVKELLRFRRRHPKGPLLWSSSPSFFRQQFKFFCDAWGLESHEFRPYSLRRGGATFLFQSTNSMEVALVKGRWQSSKVAKLYISDGLSYLPNIKMTSHTAQMLLKYHFLSPHQG
jgi:integrase